MVIYKPLYYIVTKTYLFCNIWDIFGIDPVTTRFDPDFAFEGGWTIFDFEGRLVPPDETMQHRAITQENLQF